MTAFAKLKEALLPLGIPLVTDFSGGDYDTYITINEAGDAGRNDGDDEPGCNVLSVQVHLFLPLRQDYLSLKREIRKSIFRAGYTYPSVTVLTDAELDVRHIIFEADITENI